MCKAPISWEQKSMCLGCRGLSKQYLIQTLSWDKQPKEYCRISAINRMLRCHGQCPVPWVTKCPKSHNRIIHEQFRSKHQICYWMTTSNKSLVFRGIYNVNIMLYFIVDWESMWFQTRLWHRQHRAAQMQLMPPAAATRFHIVVCSPHLFDKRNH